MDSSTENNSSEFLSKLSSHLFWDVDREKIDMSKNAKWLVGRVLNYGLLNDWIIIEKYYGLNKITELSKEIKDLDEKSMSFISVLSNVPKEDFLCYTTKQLNQGHWNF